MMDEMTAGIQAAASSNHITEHGHTAGQRMQLEERACAQDNGAQHQEATTSKIAQIGRLDTGAGQQQQPHCTLPSGHPHLQAATPAASQAATPVSAQAATTSDKQQQSQPAQQKGTSQDGVDAYSARQSHQAAAARPHKPRKRCQIQQAPALPQADQAPRLHESSSTVKGNASVPDHDKQQPNGSVAMLTGVRQQAWAQTHHVILEPRRNDNRSAQSLMKWLAASSECSQTGTYRHSSIQGAVKASAS